jgi:hypothetical protein
MWGTFIASRNEKNAILLVLPRVNYNKNEAFLTKTRKR